MFPFDLPAMGTLAQIALIIALALLVVGCATPRPGTPLPRRGDEIVIAGQLFHTGTPVVLWTDPGGYDAYRVERRFVPFDESSWEATQKAGVKDPGTPNRYSMRFAKAGTPEEIEKHRAGGWSLAEVQSKVDQFVIHYDVCGTSRTCFRILHDVRGLSVHFMLDLDGTIYQTLDVKERAWHATTANDRSVGIEIANMGAYPRKTLESDKSPLASWYAKNDKGETVITIPERLDGGGIRTPNFIGHPARPDPIAGTINGGEYLMYDLTPQQYAALAHLTATLCNVLPRIRLDYPKDESGQLIRSKMTDESLAAWTGLLGHYHIQREKIDPGPAFDWDRLMRDTSLLLR
jgi:N-acetyl-anhydromuramyl-L-alanine amidase AmpD